MRKFVMSSMLVLAGAVVAVSFAGLDARAEGEGASGGAAASATEMAGAKVFGAGVTGTELVQVSHLLAHPTDYVGKTVRVEGLAVGVCQHRGCWVDISSDKEGETVRLKVTDGVIVFPPEIMGDVITAEGVWTANQLDLETTKLVCAHEAESKGEKFDPNTVTSCMTLYQITGTGAVVRKAPASTGTSNSDGSGSSSGWGKSESSSGEKSDGAGH